jgi:hypothetical protein
MVGAHLLISRPVGGILEYFFQMFHQKLRSNLLTSFLSQILGSAVFPTQVDLFLQRKDSAGQPMGGHADSYRTLLFQVVDFVGQSYNLGEFKWGLLFAPSSMELRDSAYKRREPRFLVLIIKLGPMPSPERSLHRKVEEAGARAGLKTHTRNNLSVSGTRLVFQEKIVLEQGKIGGEFLEKTSWKWQRCKKWLGFRPDPLLTTATTRGHTMAH